jgi:hypothetical protein
MLRLIWIFKDSSCRLRFPFVHWFIPSDDAGVFGAFS